MRRGTLTTNSGRTSISTVSHDSDLLSSLLRQADMVPKMQDSALCLLLESMQKEEK